MVLAHGSTSDSYGETMMGAGTSVSVPIIRPERESTTTRETAKNRQRRLLALDHATK
jgi:hypothetical protein